MWFAVEEQNVFFFFPQPLLQTGMRRQEMWVGWHVRMHACTFAVLSTGCAAIHSVTVNAYCEKEKRTKAHHMCCLCNGTFVEDNMPALTHAIHTHTHIHTVM